MILGQTFAAINVLGAATTATQQSQCVTSSSAMAICGQSEGGKHLSQVPVGPGFKMAHEGMEEVKVDRRASS